MNLTSNGGGMIKSFLKQSFVSLDKTLRSTDTNKQTKSFKWCGVNISLYWPKPRVRLLKLIKQCGIYNWLDSEVFIID